MADFFDFISNNEFIIVICLMVIIFILIMAIIIIDVLAKNKDKNADSNTSGIEEDYSSSINIANEGIGMIAVEDVLKEISIEPVNRNNDRTNEIDEIKYVEEDEELEKTKALLELENLKKELAKIENEEKIEDAVDVQLKEQIDSKDIDEVVIPSEITQNIENKSPTIEDEVNLFEAEQEENAIISVDELAKASLTITEEEIQKYEDDGNEPISIKELEALYKSVDEPLEKEDEQKITLPDFDIRIKPAIDAYDEKTFKNTPVISPVYGLEPTEDSIMLEQTANLDKLNEEIRKTNEFLSALKELRKNLE